MSQIHFMSKDLAAVDGKGKEQTGSDFRLWAEKNAINLFASMFCM